MLESIFCREITDVRHFVHSIQITHVNRELNASQSILFVVINRTRFHAGLNHRSVTQDGLFSLSLWTRFVRRPFYIFAQLSCIISED